MIDRCIIKSTDKPWTGFLISEEKSSYMNRNVHYTIFSLLMFCDYIFSNWKTLSRIWFQMYPSLRIRWINFVHWRSFHKIEKIITTLLRFYSCVKHMLIYKRFKWSTSIRCILIVLLSIYNTISCISFVSQCTFTSIPYTVRFNKLFVALRVPLIRWPLFKA